jgi:hypothetical protein
MTFRLVYLQQHCSESKQPGFIDLAQSVTFMANCSFSGRRYPRQ